MKVPALTRNQVRQVDKIAIEQYGIPGVVLMENAGRGAAEIIDRIASPGGIAILCGSGNNAGDGYVIARHLELVGRQVRILSVIDPAKLQGDARINAVIAEKSDIEIKQIQDGKEIAESLSGVSAIIDCLLGTGARGPLRGLYADAVSATNSIAAQRFAIDIPTGLDCDTGEQADPTFQADHTITFVARKIGFEKKNADAVVGVVHEVGIGVPQKLLTALLRQA